MSRLITRLWRCSFAALVVVASLPAAGMAATGFAPVTNHPSGVSDPRTLATGDFDGDGRPDMVIAGYNWPTNTVGVLLATGSGGYAPQTSSSISGEAVAVAVGDFDADAQLDVAVAHRTGMAGGTTGVSVLRGNGDGTFGAPTDFLFAGAWSVGVGDFNGDSDLDVVVSRTNAVAVLPGDGSGAFGAAVTSSTTNAYSIDVADIDGDGDLDLAVGSLVSPIVSVLSGAGDGTFVAAGSFPVAAAVSDVVATDLNGDGRADLVTADSAADDLSVLLADGAGSFTAAVSYPGLDHPGSVAAGDFNGDSKPDLAVAETGANAASVLVGTGTGTFGAAIVFPVHRGPASIVASDLDGDGYPDLATLNGTSADVSVLRNAAPTADLSPATLSFATAAAPVPAGTVSAPQRLTITNNGAIALKVSSFELAGANPDDFFTTSDDCREPVPAGASCSVGVRFAPQAQGTRTATLTVLSDTRSGTATATLTGEGGPPPPGPRGSAGAAAPGTGELDATNGTGAANGVARPGLAGPSGPAGAPGTSPTERNDHIRCRVTPDAGISKVVCRVTGMSRARRSIRWRLLRRGAAYRRGRVAAHEGAATIRFRALAAGRYTLRIAGQRGDAAIIVS
jgi:hypothetical protein